MKTIKNIGFAFSFLSVSIATANAQIVTDGTMGAQQTLTGASVNVLESLGTRAGDNLFHSFSTFNVSSGQTVTFTGANDIQNVISRVTGAEVTSIDGLLTSQIGNANFFLLNPNGITVSSSGQIDVPAAIYLSTAQSLVFSDGNSFATDVSAASTLTLESPTSFGFLGDQGNVVVSGAVLDQVADAGALHLSAANISVSDSMVTVVDGQIGLYAVGSGVGNTELASGNSGNLSGSITLDNSLISTPGVITGGGKIHLQAADIDLSGSLLEINNTSDVAAASDKGVYVDSVNLSVTDSGNALGIATYTGVDQLTSDTGIAANISINASGTLTVGGDANITSATYAGSGNSGNISIVAGDIVISGDAAALFPAGIYTYAESGASGRSGDITIVSSGNLTVGQNGTIDASSFSDGNAGALTLDVDGNISVIDGGLVLAQSYGSGLAGTITLNTNHLNVSGEGSALAAESAVYLFETSPGNFVVLAESDGDAGQVNVLASGLVSVTDGGRISAASVANGASGVVNINASGLTIDRDGASQFTGISAEVGTNGAQAGTVNLDVSGEIALYGGGVVTASSRSDGAAGAININAASLVMDHRGAGDTLETAITSQGVADGNGGDLVVNVSGAVTILDGAQIDTTTYGAGNAGNVAVSAGSMLLDGNNNANGTGIGSQTQGAGQGGNVTVDVNGSLTILDGAQITSDAFSSGDGGNVAVTAGTISIDGENSFEVTGITSLAEWDVQVGNDVATATGHAGSVNVSSNGSVAVNNRGQISSSSQNGATGNGGNVTLNAQSLLLSNAGKVAAEVRNTIGVVGRAGDIKISVDGDIHLDQNGRISVASTTFQGGTADALSQQGSISVQANQLYVNNFSSITAQSTSDIAASNISLDVVNMQMNDSEVTTSAFNANGGAISVSSDQLIFLKDSLVTTSVFGSGNGGDITIDAPIMLMDNGFIQANTAGVGSSGGDINMQADAVVPTTGDVLVGGSERYNFSYSGSETYGDAPTIQNVIQAAAPDGINGEVNINAPEVDLSAELTVVETSVLNLNDMVWDPCATGAKGAISLQGKGGMRSMPDEPGLVSVSSSTGRFAFDKNSLDEVYAFEFSASQGGCAK